MLNNPVSKAVLEEFEWRFSDALEAKWEEHISFGEWGSGGDRIQIDDEMFWEFVEDQYMLWLEGKNDLEDHDRAKNKRKGWRIV